MFTVSSRIRILNALEYSFRCLLGLSVTHLFVYNSMLPSPALPARSFHLFRGIIEFTLNYLYVTMTSFLSVYTQLKVLNFSFLPP